MKFTLKDKRGIKWKVVEDDEDILVIAEYPNKQFRQITFWRIKENELKYKK